jgi:hypothetical protein
MIEAWEIFIILKERDLDVHVELGDDSKYAVKGEGIFVFQLESGGSFDTQDVLCVLGVKKKFLLVSAMEDKGFVITFQTGEVLIRVYKASLDTIEVIEVREGTLCRSWVKHVQDLVHEIYILCELWHNILGCYTRGVFRF